MATESGNIKMNVTLLGSKGVGKTSLVHRLCYQNMAPEINQPPNWHTCFKIGNSMFQIRDTMGSFTDFHACRDRKQALSDSQSVVLMYDATSPESLHLLPMLIDELKCHHDSAHILHMPLTIVVASKIDLAPYGSEAVTKGMQFAKAMGVPSFLCVGFGKQKC